MKHARSEYIADTLQLVQKDVLTLIAVGHPLERIMSDLCRRVESLSPKAHCAIFCVDEARRLKILAAPSLPSFTAKAAARNSGDSAFVEQEAEAHLRWPFDIYDPVSGQLVAFHKQYLPSCIRASWASPIIAGGYVVGIFAFYFTKNRGANSFERQVVSTCVDLCAIAIEQAQSRDEINRLAYFDPLTGLGNRSMLKARAEVVFQRAREDGSAMALFYLDLDGFKAVNDLHGHKGGDQLLEKVGEKLRELAPDADLLIRLGGDEFVIAQRVDQVSHRTAEDWARLFSGGIGGRYLLDDGIEATIGVSIGVARFPADGTTIECLLAHADTALYKTKDRMSGGYLFFGAEMETEVLEHRALERDVCRAADLNQLSLAYQPVVCAATGIPSAFEALLRWHHPLRGWVGADKFIPAAENSGAIQKIGAFALLEACREAATWHHPLRLAVNVSPVQIVLADFALLVETVLIETGLSPLRLEIEVTESLFIRDSDSALRTLNRLKELGVTIAIDDFGTGYSSLSTLRSFPFDRIKIDRQFVSGMIKNPDDAAIVKSVLALAHAMNLKAVAEGVETEEQKSLLRLLGCDHFQGYLFGKPLPIGEYAELTGLYNSEIANRAGGHLAMANY